MKEQSKTAAPPTGTVGRRGHSIESLEHIGVTVRDLERAIGFYGALLGARPFYRGIEERPFLGRIVGYPGCKIALAFFRLPGTRVFLELLQYIYPAGEYPAGEPVNLETLNPGVAHFCLVVSDLDQELERISALGATARSSSPVERPGGGRALYLRDPDGLTIELQERPEPTLEPPGPRAVLSSRSRRSRTGVDHAGDSGRSSRHGIL